MNDNTCVDSQTFIIGNQDVGKKKVSQTTLSKQNLEPYALFFTKSNIRYKHRREIIINLTARITKQFKKGNSKHEVIM